jgi:mevalonate pyrophosphate decarboxylase
MHTVSKCLFRGGAGLEEAAAAAAAVATCGFLFFQKM